MLDYSREIYSERDRANNDHWDARALLPTKQDVSESDEEETEDEREEREYDKAYRD